MSHAHIKVWDPLVRLFHWTFAGAFLVAMVVEDHIMWLHSWAGYIALAALAVRLLWGFVGTRHARFTDFVHSPRTVLAYLSDVIRFRARRYVGHNPAGGAMVIALMLSVALTGLTGIATYGAKEFAGPMAFLGYELSAWSGEALEESHEFFAHFTLLLVGLHLLGVVIASLQHRENLIRSMVTGLKPQQH